MSIDNDINTRSAFLSLVLGPAFSVLRRNYQLSELPPVKTLALALTLILTLSQTLVIVR